MFFQFATVIWLEKRKSACSIVLPACRDSSASAAPWPHPERCWLLWKQHSAALGRTGDAGGTIHRLIETYWCSHVNLYRVQFHWDWVVIYPLLWKPLGLWLSLPMGVCGQKRFCTSGSISLWATLFRTGLSVCSRAIFLCVLCHVCQRDVGEGKGGWDGCPPAEPFWQSPKSSLLGRLATQESDLPTASPGSLLQLRYCRLSEQERPSTRRCIITVTRHFSVHYRIFLEGDQICCILIL